MILVLGSWMFAKRVVWMNDGITRVVLIRGVLYLPQRERDNQVNSWRGREEEEEEKEERETLNSVRIGDIDGG